MMKKVALLAFALGFICTAHAQTTDEKYDTNAEMQQQMALIINTLGLDNMEVYQLGQIMEAKRLEKEKVLAEIELLKMQLQKIEAEKEYEIKGILTDSEWEKYESEIKEKTDKVNDDQMKTIDK